MKIDLEFVRSLDKQIGVDWGIGDTFGIDNEWSLLAETYRIAADITEMRTFAKIELEQDSLCFASVNGAFSGNKFTMLISRCFPLCIFTNDVSEEIEEKIREHLKGKKWLIADRILWNSDYDGVDATFQGKTWGERFFSWY